MDKIFTLLQVRNEESHKTVEFISSLIHSQFKELGKLLIGEFERSILDIFENDDFFVCTKKTLGYWMDIIRYTVAQSKQDVLSMYLNKVVFSSYWSSEDYKNKTRIKSFSRVCFIIFSGEPETFMTKDKIKGLLDKIKEVIKDVNAHPSLISLVAAAHQILFSIRVLILRLSLATLNEVFRTIWPILITLIMQIFSKPKADKSSLKMVLEALKLIELISIKNIEEFYLYQWIFVYDCTPGSPDFGIGFVQSEDKKNLPNTSAFAFNASISRILPKDSYVQFKQQQVDHQLVDFPFESKKRRIIIKESSVALGERRCRRKKSYSKSRSTSCCL